ncbi:hypothetical protein KAS08_00845 [Candidatus Pacearchaeota archaeon]|nr:hypothetical protein [Candidatus Pacearchaeota archaeon]
MEKPRIKEISSQEYENGRIDKFFLYGEKDIHKELINFLVAIGISEDKVNEFDFITSENRGCFFIFDKDKKINLFVSENEICLTLDSNILKKEIMVKIEKYFQIF